MKRTFSRDFKLQVARQAYTGEKRIAQLCREHNLCQTLVRRWRREYELFKERAFPEHNGTQASNGSQPQPEPDAETRIAELEAALGRAHLQIELLQRALQKGGSFPRRNGA